MDLSDLCHEDRCDRCDWAQCEHHCHAEQYWSEWDGWSEVGGEYRPADVERPIETIQAAGGVL